MAHVIDVDRGVSIRQIVKFDDANPRRFDPDPKFGGMVVYMYKDDPGVYYDVHGNTVPENLARRAGFDTKAHKKEYLKRQAMQNFEKKLAAELAMDRGDDEIVIREAGDWKVVSLPGGRARVIDKANGLPVVAVPMTEDDALAMLDDMTKEAEDEMEVNVKEKK